jgi:hypothetical protein
MERQCPKCHGSGQIFRAGFTYENRTYPDEMRQCLDCEGRGNFAPIDVVAIHAAIKGRNGLRSKRPENRRAYYVWRMARFHGGADVTMPVIAMMELGDDPFRPELDILADAVARRVYGSDLAAAYRWRGALGGSGDVPDGLPPTSYAGGPVCVDGKDESELPELC